MRIWLTLLILIKVKYFTLLFSLRYFSPDLFVDYKNGDEVNGYNLETDGFKKPIVVHNKSGLRMKVPPPNFTLHDVVDFTDPEIQITVIDVENQCDSMMPLGEFVDKFYEKPRKRILNVLSFEYSRTKWVHFNFNLSWYIFKNLILHLNVISLYD